MKDLKIKLGKHGGVIVFDEPLPEKTQEKVNSGHWPDDHRDYYGGVLVAESLYSKEIGERIVACVNAMQGIENPQKFMDDQIADVDFE